MKHLLCALLALMLVCSLLCLPSVAEAVSNDTTPPSVTEEEETTYTAPLPLDTAETLVPILIYFALALLCMGFGLTKMRKHPQSAK